MDRTFDPKNFNILWTAIQGDQKPELKQSIGLVAIFGLKGTELIYVTKEDKVYGFGSNKSGCLGLGSNKPQLDVPRLNPTLSGKRLVNIFCGLDHCIGLTVDGKCYGWGFNEYGRLGIGNTESINTPQLIQTLVSKFVVNVTIGSAHTLALTNEGKVYGWGRNHFGQLGLGHFNHRYHPTMLNLTQVVTYVASGVHHSVALTQDGRIIVWGINDEGQLGIILDQTKKNPKGTFCLCFPEVLQFGKTTFMSIACGRVHTLLLTTDGIVFAFGSNHYGQIGDPMTTGSKYYPFQIPLSIRFKRIIADRDNNMSMAIAVDDQIYVWGHVQRMKVIIPKRVPTDLGRSVLEIYTKLSFNEIPYTTVRIGDEMNQKTSIEDKEKDQNTPLQRNNRKGRRNGNDHCFHRNQNARSKKPVNENRRNINNVHNDIPRDNTQTFGHESQKTLENDESKETKDNSKDQEPDGREPVPELAKKIEDLMDSEPNDAFKTDNSSLFEEYCSVNSEPPEETSSLGETNDLLSVGSKSSLKLQRLLSEAFDDPTDADIKFEFRDGNALFCHKTILQIRNKKFWSKCTQYLDNNFATVRPVCELQRFRTIGVYQKYSYESFRAFLTHLYGIEPELELNSIGEVLTLANIYDEPELKDLCHEWIERSEGAIDLANVCSHYQKAINKDFEALREYCVEIAANNWKTICKSEEFQAMSDDLCERFMYDIFRFNAH